MSWIWFWLSLQHMIQTKILSMGKLKAFLDVILNATSKSTMKTGSESIQKQTISVMLLDSLSILSLKWSTSSRPPKFRRLTKLPQQWLHRLLKIFQKILKKSTLLLLNNCWRWVYFNPKSIIYWIHAIWRNALLVRTPCSLKRKL